MTERPNIIMFTWHDAGDWFGCYGYDTVNTPNVDRLASEGVRFTNQHSACAQCSPSRASIMTGTYCQNNGVMGLTNTVFSNRMHPHIPHLGPRLKNMGYDTALFGIQHECAHEDVHEIIQPDEQFATDPWPNADLIRAYVKKWIHERANNDTPFYAQMGTIDAHLNRYYSGVPASENEPYAPVQDTSKGLHIPPYLTGSEADKQTVATLQGLLQRGDRLMGDVLAALDETGLADNTLVIMCVDHGVGLTRAKVHCYDPGTKVGWIMRWPKHIAANSTVDNLCAHADVLPTILELLGENISEENFDGHSLAEHVRGNSTTDIRPYTYSHMTENTRSIRSNKWKLIRNFSPPRVPVGHLGDCASQHKLFDNPYPQLPGSEQAPDEQRPALELYDLENDPNELQNLSYDPKHAETLKQLNAELWNFLITHDDFLIHDPIRTPWQLATRQALEQHCADNNITPPMAEGPLGNAIDAASDAGNVAAGWEMD